VASKPDDSLLIQIAESETDLAHCFDIRTRVFVGEQDVPPELELDELDKTAVHFLAWLAGEPIGVARLLNYNRAHRPTAKIGRVAVLKHLRGKGYGLALMEAILDFARQRDFEEAILDSQTYALPFYEKLGFIAEGPEFLDAGIPHFRMRLRL